VNVDVDFEVGMDVDKRAEADVDVVVDSKRLQ
jgi:hypothetical protein